MRALKIYLGLIDQAFPADMPEQKERLAKSKQILANLVERGHNISELLRPSELDELGLVESLAALASSHQELTGARYHFQRPSASVTLPSEHRLVLYRVAQEALTNIAKHAHASQVMISLEQQGRAVVLSVRDNGVGCDAQELLRRPRRRKDDTFRLGLLGLRERVELLGGQLTIKTSPGKGTTVTANLTPS